MLNASCFAQAPSAYDEATATVYIDAEGYALVDCLRGLDAANAVGRSCRFSAVRAGILRTSTSGHSRSKATQRAKGALRQQECARAMASLQD